MDEKNKIKVLNSFNLLLLLFNSFFVFCFNEKLVAETGNDSLYLKSLQIKATFWEDRDLDSSNYYSKFQVREAVRLKRNHFISTAFNQLACNAKRAGKSDSAFYFFSKAEELAKPFGIKGAYPSIVYNRAQLYRLTNQLDKAIIELKQVAQFDIERHDFNLLSGTLNELGNCMIANDQVADGVKYFMLAYQVSAHFKDTLMMGGISINLASEFLNLKLTSEAEKMALNSLHWFKLADNPRGISFASNLLAQLEVKIPTRSLQLRRQALFYGLKSNDISHLASVYEGLGSYYNTHDQMDSSLFYHKKAIIHRRIGGQYKMMSSSYYNIASVFFEKGMLNEAKINLDSLFSLPEQGNAELLYFSHRLNARIDSAMNNYKDAHKHLLAALEFNERYFNDETKNQLLRSQANLENQKKELTLKNTFLSKELNLNSEIYKQKRRNIFFSILFIGLILLFIGIYYYRRRKHLERELKLKLQLYKSEMDGLESQINTHFIYNTLSVIQQFIYQNMPDMAITSLNQFASLLRLSLSHSRKGYATLQSELEALRLYVDLESHNLESGIEFMINIPPEIQSNQLKIPPMLIQPLVENALKHGISSKSDIRGQIWITVQIQTQAVLKIVVRDNGPEFSAKKSSSGLSFSSGIIKDRLSLLNKQLKRTDFKLELRSEYFLNQSTTVAEITLPFFS